MGPISEPHSLIFYLSLSKILQLNLPLKNISLKFMGLNSTNNLDQNTEIRKNVIKAKKNEYLYKIKFHSSFFFMDFN